MKPPNEITLDSELPTLGVDVSDFFGATSISFVVADPNRPDCPIIYVNRAFELTTGYSHRFVIGRNCRFLQGPDTDREAVRNIAVALSRGEAVRQTLLNYRADGSAFTNDLVITPIQDPNGKVVFFVGVQREIPEGAPETEEALRRKTVDIVRQQVQMHLSVVMEMSRMHIGDLDAPTEQPADFLSLLRRLEILDLLYENLSEASLQDDRLDVGAYVSQIAAKLFARAPRAGFRINISTEAALVPLDIAVRLGVILAEIVEVTLSESFAHTNGGLMEVVLRNEGNQLVLSVYDDGQEERDAQDWLARGDLTLRVIRKLLADMDAHIAAPVIDAGREIQVVVPLTALRGRD